jgi:glutaredoxin-related protein
MGIPLEGSKSTVENASRKLETDTPADYLDGQLFSEALDMIREMSEEDALRELLSKERSSRERRK